MRRFSALAKALKATAVVIMLTLVWALPAAAHSGHGSTRIKSAVLPAFSAELAVRKSPAAASLSRDDATACAVTRASLSAPLDDTRCSGGLARGCCGTMCSVAVIQLSINSMPMRALHRFRRYLPTETIPHTGTSKPLARPPRTPNIA